MEMFRAIDALPLMGDGEPMAILLSPMAERVFSRWSDANSEEAVRLGGALRGFYVKLEAHVARFILILHVADDPARCSETVPPETVHRAIRMGEFFRQEIHRLIPLLQIGSGQGSQTMGLWSRVRGLILRKGRLVDCSNGRYRCMSKKALLQGLSGVKTEELTNELDTYNDLGEVVKWPLESPTKPGFEYCVSLDLPIHQSTNLPNGRKVEADGKVEVPW
jgi:hypothetical protein